MSETPRPKGPSGSHQVFPAQAIDVPRLNFAILNARGDEIVTWSTLPDRDQLAAGASMEFASHYTVPPGNAREVVVRFSSRGTAAAGPK